MLPGPRVIPANIYLFKVNIGKIRNRSEICSKFVNFEHISYLFLVFLLLALNK